MALTEITIKNAKTDLSKPNGYRLKPAEKGMYVWIHNNGSKYFRLDYRINSKRNTLALGIYPETSLKEAREKRDIAKKQIADGIDPNFERKMKKLGAIENTFQAIALEWYERNMTAKSESHQKRINALFQRDLFPWLGNKPIADIKAPELLATLQRIESRNAIETAHRALQVCGQVLRYAIATGRTEYDITQALKGALTQVKGGHLASMTEPVKVKDLLRSIDGYSGGFVVKSALQLAPLVFVRPSELRRAEWEHINFDTKEWRYLVTKTNTPHIVPLSR